LLQEAQEMALRVHQIAELGVGLVIDDFGTGYSSLAYLKNCRSPRSRSTRVLCGLPHDAGDKAIVGAIISMGQALGVELVAEGVETQEQCQAIEQLQATTFRAICARQPCLRSNSESVWSKAHPSRSRGSAVFAG
jgi:EAL domain-containing protein (putative c-di-GMP-specific phosphodiesterase class I)